MAQSSQFMPWETHSTPTISVVDRVKSGIFEQTAKFGQRPCLYLKYWNKKNKLTKQTVKILMRLFANVCPNLPGV